MRSGATAWAGRAKKDWGRAGKAWWLWEWLWWDWVEVIEKERIYAGNA